MSTDPTPDRGERTLPREVRELERIYLNNRRRAAGVHAVPSDNQKSTGSSAGEHEPPATVQPTVGLALSGGGIRSATFNLGALQSLAKKSALKFVDYICTVSGGGYIGSCLSSLMSQWVLKDEDKRIIGASNPTADDRYIWPPEALPLHSLDERSPLFDKDQLHHLRRHGDFLITRRGIFAVEVLRAVGHTLTNILLSLITCGLLLLGGAGLLLLLISAMEGDGFWRTIWSSPHPSLAGLLCLFAGVPDADHGRVWYLLTDPFVYLAAAGGAIVMALIYILFMRFPPRRFSAGTGESAEERGLLRRTRIALAGLITGCLVTSALLLSPLQRFVPRPVQHEGDVSSGISACLCEDPIESLMKKQAPSFVYSEGALRSTLEEAAASGCKNCPAESIATVPWLVSQPSAAPPAHGGPPPFGALMIPLVFFFAARLTGAVANIGFAQFASHWNRVNRSAVGALLGVSTYLMVASLLLPILPVLVVTFRGFNWTPAISAAVALLSGRSLLPAADGKSPTGLRALARKFKSGLLTLLVLLGLGLTLVFLAKAILQQVDFTPEGVPRQELFAVVIASAVGLLGFAIMGFIVDFNRLSPHYFYRDRLAETFLRTEQVAGDEVIVTRDDSEIALVDLHGRRAAASGCSSFEPAYTPSPYHLIMSSLNLGGSKDLARRTRKSDVFVFSKLFCGSTTTGYVPTGSYRGGETKLARAMTISGAAASPAMGVYTSLATSIVMTLFNVRLGQWLVNPRRDRDVIHSGFRGKAQGSGSGRRRIRERLIWWPLYLFREMFGSATADLPLVHLSDGGHTGDNVGVYPLLQRRCDLILANDAGCDPEYAFQDLSNAIRMIEVDENVKVEMRDLESIRPGAKDGRSKKHWSVGRILYPDCTPPKNVRDAGGQQGRSGAGSTESSGSTDPDAAPKTAWIIYFKSSLTGDEAASVASYKRAHEEYPHESTADQFFDDEQFEAYRVLGAHVYKEFFEDVEAKCPGRDPYEPSNWIAYCEEAWKPHESSRSKADS
ncbi:MAG TPA: patatin-like phospholipase family protein [Candidatus Saccharimonadales bacterium]|nr:patatin-like phospholipase family protein [Candidatus Saccharimonadales bacterium]